jgi:hypothetical protein
LTQPLPTMPAHDFIVDEPADVTHIGAVACASPQRHLVLALKRDASWA